MHVQQVHVEIRLHLCIGNIMYRCTSIKGGARVHSFAVSMSPTLTEDSEDASFACEANFGNAVF